MTTETLDTSKALLLLNSEGDAFVMDKYVSDWEPTGPGRAVLSAWEALVKRFRNWEEGRVSSKRFSETRTCWLPMAVLPSGGATPLAVLQAEFSAKGDPDTSERDGRVEVAALRGRLDAALLVARSGEHDGVAMDIVEERPTYLVVRVWGPDPKAVGDRAVALSALFEKDRVLPACHEWIS